MAPPVLRLKILPKPVIKGKMDVRFPGSVTAISPILIDKTGGNFIFSVDINALAAMMATIFQPNELFEQHITNPGPATIGSAIGIVRVDQTVGAAITLNLPPAANKSCPVLIADWKGDAGTNNITITPSGTEKIQGRSSWKIAGDTGSIFLRPIAGIGYVR
ncbi:MULTISPECIES: hypothetical protein [Bradyrhizobium]|uniref:Blr4532 protein n=2 Tax=Bradyrhizobium diazoefficiens TaxID=1355477 RepID=Q89LL2_BRADU|nr:hypothetical protein [Bradyrhizobium diazoefficiens]MBP1065428.1 hypothetical protein [Bradyrhizobium japonicum]AND89809.1 hypothetical protein AAV28_19890 [Bradyrhizobium diazoefficiens USDA 110]AWO91463.1 hypothetical protein DI395_25165 [Bradyrhizobium diazoefficiens]QBP23308.1 hypothetical protein Bdiaspc4_23690 [Bradyrhizobium diazoefficiens]QLD43670.1 hypothetical protein HUW42_23010 [Bradyrhizobium diazoefficiens]